jgi:hypothetical protein
MTSLYPRERVEAILQPLTLPVCHRILLKTLSVDPRGRQPRYVANHRPHAADTLIAISITIRSGGKRIVDNSLCAPEIATRDQRVTSPKGG